MQMNPAPFDKVIEDKLLNPEQDNKQSNKRCGVNADNKDYDFICENQRLKK